LAFDFGDRVAFIRGNLAVVPVPGREDLSVYRAHARSGLSRLDEITGQTMPTPYWAHLWPGGLALVQYLGAASGAVAGKLVLDLGAGSGVVGIAAARAGATAACSDIDPMAEAAIWLNAGLNGVEVETVGDVLDGPADLSEVILVGDVFYTAELADRVLAFLRRAQAAGAEVLIGDVGRATLPREALEPIATFPAKDVGDGPKVPPREAVIYRLR
jgi:predicted nicotinamide N-methyase